MLGTVGILAHPHGKIENHTSQLGAWTAMALDPAIVEVVGDQTVDWRVAVRHANLPSEAIRTSALNAAYRWEGPEYVAMSAIPGGPSAIAELIRLACKGSGRGGPVDVESHEPDGSITNNPHAEEITHILTVLEPQTCSEQGQERTAWRIRESFGPRKATQPRVWTKTALLETPPRCIVVDDGGYGHRENGDTWSDYIKQPHDEIRHVIVKTRYPLVGGGLWSTLRENFGEKLTVYVPAYDLRRSGLTISQPLSWERTSTDVVKAIRRIRHLASARRVIVSLGLDGAVLIDRDGHDQLIFDPLNLESGWEAQYIGIPTMWGTCLTAAITAECVNDPEDPKWTSSIRRGLMASRKLHEQGFIVNEEKHSISFPYETVVGELTSMAADQVWSEAKIPEHVESWSIMNNVFDKGLEDAAIQILTHGVQAACKDIPIERIGRWVSVDRTEIESMRSIRNIISEYVESNPTKPLSIAVFGPPGAGKSYAIRQMAKYWKGGSRTIQDKVINLSQYTNERQLAAEYHSIRDLGLQNILPMVIWDEFDSGHRNAQLMWLPHFLAPMQDGEFLDEHGTRPIGAAIFVFVGSTSPTMQSFQELVSLTVGEVPKARDFVSRLRGHVDILGPNPRDGSDDKAHMLRRAFLLRASLQSRKNFLSTSGESAESAIIKIDRGVANAFLRVGRFAHGARSMEAIVHMSSLGGKSQYERASLPASHQLRMHVDDQEFLRIVEETEPGLAGT